MAFKVFNEILSANSTAPKSVLKYTNTTRRKLFFNKFDLLPDVQFVRHGIIIVRKNGIVVFTNLGIIENPLRKYSQFPIRDKILYLERFDEFEILIYDATVNIKDDVKLTVSISLDVENIPEFSNLIPFSLLDLAQVSTTLDVFLKENYVNDFGTRNYFDPINVEGYSNMIISIITSEDYHPSIISNIHNPVPVGWYEMLEGSYLGNVSALTRTGDLTKTIGEESFTQWQYENEDYETGGLQVYDKNNMP